MREYITRHYRSWCDFAKRAGYGVRCSDIRLVTAYDSTGKYSAMVFSQNDQRRLVDFELVASDVARASATWGRWRCQFPRMHETYGPREGHEDSDQCVFLRSYRAYPRIVGPVRIEAEAEPQDMDPTDDNEAAQAVTQVDSVETTLEDGELESLLQGRRLMYKSPR